MAPLKYDLEATAVRPLRVLDGDLGSHPPLAHSLDFLDEGLLVEGPGVDLLELRPDELAGLRAHLPPVPHAFVVLLDRSRERRSRGSGDLDAHIELGLPRGALDDLLNRLDGLDDLLDDFLLRQRSLLDGGLLGCLLCCHVHLVFLDGFSIVLVSVPMLQHPLNALC